MRSFLSLILLIATLQHSDKVASLPTSAQTIQFLKQSIDWHQQVHELEQIPTTAADETFLNDARSVEKQILGRSFDFAKAEAKLLSKQNAPASTDDTTEVAGYSALSKQAAAADQEVKDTLAEMEDDRKKLATAEGAKLRQLQSTIDELQAEVNLAKTRADTFKSILQFVESSGSSGTNLDSQINELQRSVPELAVETAKPGSAPAVPAAPATAPVAASQARSQEPAGILGLITSVFSLSSKMHTLDQAVQATDNLANQAQLLRTPIVQNLVVAAQQGEELAKAADTAGPDQLEQEKKDLDTLTARFKDISSVVVPLQQQYLSFGIYKAGLERWKATIENDRSADLRALLVRGIVLGVALGIVFALAEIWRKATLKYVKDIRRRYQFLLIRRIVLWCAIAITIAFAMATEIGSLATFAGLITAGIAVALQNVIVAIAGYFFLVGKYGVRVGDRVQISGVTGNVVDVGLFRLHLMELGGSGNNYQPTGRVVVFSNSVVFQPTASFFKQIPGTSFGWHEVTLTLSPDSDYHMAEERLLGAVNTVYATYSKQIEAQHRHMEKSFAFNLEMPQPKSRLRLTQTGLEVVIRYPLELERSVEVDDQIIRELLTALEKPPKLKLVGSGTPNIQQVPGGNTAA